MADTPTPEGAYYIDDGGNTIKVPKEQAGTAEHLGYTPATPEQVSSFEKERKYGGGVNTALAGAAALARGPSLGISDQLLTKSHLVNPETLKGLEEAHPVASGIGEGAGILASLLVPGEGELNLTKGVSRLGQGAERLAARGLEREGTGLVERTAAKAASKAVGGSLEGVAYSGGHEISEDALGDPHQNAQSILAHLGTGALFGGALGGFLGAGEELVPAAVSAAKDSAATLGGKLRQAGLEKYIPWAAKANDVPESFVRDMMENGAPEAMDKAAVAKDLASGFQETADKASEVSRKLHTDVLPAESESLIQDVYHSAKDTAKQAYGDVFQKLEDATGRMRAEPELHNQSYARQLEKIKDGFARDAGAGENPVDVFNRMKTLKRSIDDVIPYGKDAMSLSLSDRNAIGVLKDLRSTVKQTLTDESVFGQAAARQAATDSAVSEFKQAEKQFNKFFTVKTPRKGGGFSQSVDQEKFATYLGKLEKDKGDARSQVLDDYLKAHENMVKTAEDSFQNAPVKNFDTKGLGALVEKQGAAVKDAKQAVARDSMVKQFGGAEAGGVSLPDLGAAAVAHSHPLLAGAYTAVKAGKAALSFAKDVPRAAAALASIQRAAESIGRAIDAGAAAITSGGKAAAALGRGEAAAGAVGYFNADKRAPGAVFAEHGDELNRMANNPDYLLSKLEEVGGPIGKHAPKTTMALHMARTRAVQYLQGQLPKLPNLGPLGPKLKPTGADLWKFNRSFNAVTKPLSIMKLAAAGKLTPLDVQGVQVVHPQLHAQIVQAITGQLAKGPEGVPYRQRLMLGILTGQSLDGSATPFALQSNQAAYNRPSAKSAENQTGPAALGTSTQAGLSKLSVGHRAMLPGQAAAFRREEQ